MSSPLTCGVAVLTDAPLQAVLTVLTVQVIITGRAQLHWRTNKVDNEIYCSFWIQLVVSVRWLGYFLNMKDICGCCLA